MGIITGYICLGCFLILVLKFIARKSGKSGINKFFGKLHKPVSVLFLICCVLHLFLVIPTMKTRNVFVLISGFAAMGIMFLLIILCHTIKNGKKKMYWHRVLSVFLLVVILFHIVIYFIDFGQYKEKIASIKISEVDISAVKDGKYIGEYDAGYIYAKVRVTVENGKIDNIEILEHQNERGKKAESITDKMLEEQSTAVDAVTSATNSSLVIKKACENALLEGSVKNNL